jgi:hypothetical protein
MKVKVLLLIVVVLYFPLDEGKWCMGLGLRNEIKLKYKYFKPKPSLVWRCKS